MEIKIKDYPKTLFPFAKDFVSISKDIDTITVEDKYKINMIEVHQKPFHRIGYCEELQRVFYSLSRGQE